MKHIPPSTFLMLTSYERVQVLQAALWALEQEDACRQFDHLTEEEREALVARLKQMLGAI